MRILIAEDEISTAKALKVILEKNKFSVDIVHNGDDAWSYVRTTPYEVVVLDIMMPGISGMNAGIRIETEEPAGCLTVPAAAICDEGGKTWVYTSYDEENDELTGLTEVVTGRSDGEYVEIVSGIKTGDKVCYRYADTIEYNFLRRS